MDDGWTLIKMKWSKYHFCVYQTVQELHNIKAQIHPISKLAHELREFHKEHVRLITEMQEKLHKKESENADLHSRVDALTVELQASKWSIFTKTPSNIVLSDSILGDVDQSKLVNTKMVSSSGGRVQTLQDELKKPEYHGAKYNNITFMAGTNDLQYANGDAEKVTAIIDKYIDLINMAKAIAGNITVSSVCPRLDNVKDMIEPFNVSLQVLCEQNGVTFIDNTPILTIGERNINDGYLAAGKGPHLTKPGVNKLVRNLKLKLVNVERDITKAPGRHPHNNKAKPPTAIKYNANAPPHPQHASSGQQWKQPYSPRQQTEPRQQMAP